MIKVGDIVPQVMLQRMDDGKVVSVDTRELLSGKKTVIFAVPGAFTPTCSEQHLPGYVGRSFDFRKKGVDQIICVSVNDAYVMHAWAREQSITNEVMMLADGSGDFTRAIGMELDLSKFGFGLRSRRYAMLIDDGVVSVLLAEINGGELKVSNADSMMDALV